MQPVKASGAAMVVVVPATGVVAADLTSDGEQSSVPPLDGMYAMPSTVYEATMALSERDVPLAENVPVKEVAAGSIMV